MKRLHVFWALVLCVALCAPVAGLAEGEGEAAALCARFIAGSETVGYFYSQLNDHPDIEALWPQVMALLEAAGKDGELLDAVKRMSGYEDLWQTQTALMEKVTERWTRKGYSFDHDTVPRSSANLLFYAKYRMSEGMLACAYVPDTGLEMPLILWHDDVYKRHYPLGQYTPANPLPMGCVLMADACEATGGAYSFLEMLRVAMAARDENVTFVTDPDLATYMIQISQSNDDAGTYSNGEGRKITVRNSTMKIALYHLPTGDWLGSWSFTNSARDNLTLDLGEYSTSYTMPPMDPAQSDWKMEEIMGAIKNPHDF